MGAYERCWIRNCATGSMQSTKGTDKSNEFSCDSLFLSDLFVYDTFTLSHKKDVIKAGLLII
eukprot:snap_masked-scaffold_46-processed-gene-0.37-mRNA-1 protein AED:1.00 eAED:1.00 QI:0/0/0/0/1/1/2/0/61